MTLTHWLAIGTFVGGVVFSVVWWHVRKRASRLEALEAAVFGAEGVTRHLAKYVTHAELQRELGALGVSLRGVSEEGQRREERIVAAIEQQTANIGREVRDLKEDLRAQVVELRQDVRSQQKRVDDFMMAANAGGR